MNGLVGLATISTREGHDEKAIELLAIPLSHPATRHEASVRAQRLLDDLATRLPPNSVQTQLHAARVRTPWELAEVELRQRKG